MKTGFVPALGTPIDENGNLVVDSYKKQIETMIAQGAAAILSMGSMGQQAFLRNEVCAETAKVAVEAVKGRVPVYVGCMDNSISRAKARIASMEGLDLTAFVFTTPYYEVDSDAQCITYFKAVAAATKHGVILYDLPGVTNHKITYEMVCTLHEQVPNLIGIKSADLYMLRKLRLNPLFNDFKIFYSGLDAFDIAYPWDIGCILDGMLPCTPVNTGKLIRALDAGDKETAAKHLDNIIALRDLFCDCDLGPAFSAAMNLLGFEGLHAPDWVSPVSEETKDRIRAELIRIGELGL